MDSENEICREFSIGKGALNSKNSNISRGISGLESVLVVVEYNEGRQLLLYFNRVVLVILIAWYRIFQFLIKPEFLIDRLLLSPIWGGISYG